MQRNAAKTIDKTDEIGQRSQVVSLGKRSSKRVCQRLLSVVMVKEKKKKEEEEEEEEEEEKKKKKKRVNTKSDTAHIHTHTHTQVMKVTVQKPHSENMCVTNFFLSRDW